MIDQKTVQRELRRSGNIRFASKGRFDIDELREARRNALLIKLQYFYDFEAKQELNHFQNAFLKGTRPSMNELSETIPKAQWRELENLEKLILKKINEVRDALKICSRKLSEYPKK